MTASPCPHSPQETGSCFLVGNHRTRKVEANHSIARGYHLEARIQLHSALTLIVQSTNKVLERHSLNMHCIIGLTSNNEELNLTANANFQTCIMF